jgi:hypothetical protein
MTTGTNLKIVQQQTEQSSLKRLGLENWEAWHQLPEGVTLPALKAELEIVERTLEPASSPQMAVGIAKLLDFARAFGITNAEGSQVRSMAEFYRQGFEDVPGDLVLLACERASREWRWGNRMPLPADLKAMISEELGRRRVVQARIRSAMMKARVPEPRPPLPPVGVKPEVDAILRKSREVRRNPDREMTADEIERRRLELLAMCES